MAREYLITSNPFDGTTESFIDDGIVQYSGEEMRSESFDERGIKTITISYRNGLTPEQYAKKNEYAYWRVVDNDELSRLRAEHNETYLTDWEEISEEDFMYFLEVLPPLRYNGKMFFVREPITDNIYRCCIQKADKFYSSNRRINEPNRSIYASTKNI